MEGQERTCAACGHRCHCYQPECEEYPVGFGAGDGIPACDCDTCRCNHDPLESPIPDSFFKRN